MRQAGTHPATPRSSLANESGKLLTMVLLLMVSYFVVFAATFYVLNGRSFKTGRTTAEAEADSSDARADSLRQLRRQIDSLLVLVAGTRSTLDSLSTEVEQRRKELAHLEERLKEAVSQERQEQLRRARKLASILAALPDSAMAPTLAGLDDNLLVMVLEKSTQKNAARVLAALGPKRAAHLSKRLVRMN